MKNKIKFFLKKKKIIHLYKSMIRKVSCSSSPFLRYFVGDKLFFLVMTCLQLISFFTTLSGAKYYFGDLFPSAPLVFTVGIQCGFLWLSYTYAKIKHRKKINGFFLILFAVISMSFSYTGLVTTSLPPEEEYNKTFNKYVSEADSVRDIILNENSDIDSIENNASLFLPKVNTLLKLTKAKIDSLENSINKLQDIYDSNNIVNRTYDENGNLISSSESKGNAATKVSSQLGDMTKSLTEFKQLKKDLKQKISQVTSEQIREYVTTTEKANTSTDLQTDISQIIISYNNLADKLDNVDKLNENYIEDLRNRYLYFSYVENVNDELDKKSTSDTEDTSLLLDKIINGNSSATTAVKRLNSLKNAVNENYLNLSSIVNYLKLDSQLLDKVLMAKEELDNYGDPNVQAFAYLFNDTYRNKILGIALIAFMVDGLTFLLGFFGNSNSFPILDSNSNREIESEDQLFSIIFLSLVSENFPNKLKEKNIENFEKECYQYIEQIRTYIHDFIGKFEIYPYLTEWGYCLRVKKSEIESDPKMNPIISILLQLQYMTYISEEELTLLEKHYRNENIDGYKITYSKNNNGYYFLRYRMEAYLRYSLAETTIDSINFEIN